MTRRRAVAIGLAVGAALTAAACQPIRTPLVRGLRSPSVVMVQLDGARGLPDAWLLHPAGGMRPGPIPAPTDLPPSGPGWSYLSFDTDGNYSQELVAIGTSPDGVQLHAAQVSPPTGGVVTRAQVAVPGADPGTRRYAALDVNHDRVIDLVAVDVAAGSVTLHAADGATGFATPLFSITVALTGGPDWRPAPFDADGDCRSDLGLVRRDAADATELVVLSGATLLTAASAPVHLAVDLDEDVDVVSIDDDWTGRPALLFIDRQAPEGTAAAMTSTTDGATVSARWVLRDHPSPRSSWAFAAANFAPSGGPVESIPSPDPGRLVNVGGSMVHPCVAADVAAMYAHAARDGISLSGSGYRSFDEQVAARRKACRGDIWRVPTESCSPPTAPPGLSMHQRGMAIDLRANGASIRSRSSPAFRWLAANAWRYGFRNYPPEPWHWSTNGE